MRGCSLVVVFFCAVDALVIPMTMGGDGDVKRWFASNGFGDVKKRGGSFGGSGWASTARWDADDGQSFFVKSSSRTCEAMFRGEAAGLRAMRAAALTGGEPSLKIPEVFAAQNYDDGRGSFVVMEFLDLAGRGDPATFGRAMARMHLAPGASEFGFECDNSIGATPQPNGWASDWPQFFAEKRLAHQVNLAGDAAIDRVAKELLPRVPDFFPEPEPIVPSIIHGDLWSGNIGTASGQPTIFDPACYYAHHEAEWGMSWCASLGPSFWAGYRELVPEAPGFAMRRPLYEAYHQLNHYNLFGGGYRGAAVSCMQQALSKLDAFSSR